MDIDEKIKHARLNIIKALGPNLPVYVKCVRKWFEKEIDKTTLDEEVQKYISPAQIQLHNDFVLAIVDKIMSSLLPTTEEIISTGCKRKDMDDCIEVNSAILNEELSYKAINYRVVPSDMFIHGRLVMMTWGNGLQDIQDNACELIETAALTFLKNILSVVISRRSGFKVYRGRMMYDHGVPVHNPWLANTAQYNSQADCSTKAAETEDGSHVKIPDHKKLVQDTIFRLAATSSRNHITRTSLISIDDLIDTLRVHRHVIPSTSMYSWFMQKLLMTRSHPSDDELECEKDEEESD